MQEESKSNQCDEEDEGFSDKTRQAKSSHMVITQPSTDSNRYLVDKFNNTATKSKQAPFESIDINLYQPSARCSAFCTSESRLLVWITVFANRYYQLLNEDGTGYKAVWEEQDAYSTPSKCEKIVLHLYSTTVDSEDQLVALTVFVSTGRIMIQGKMYEDWCAHEFPVLLDIVNAIEPVPTISWSDNAVFTSSLPHFFKNFVQFIPDDDIPSSGKATVAKISAQKLTTETPQTPHSELISSTLTPSRLKQISFLRNTLGELEAEFTQHKLKSDGDIQQLKDKLVQQDNVLKLQNKQFADLASNLSSQVTSLNDLLQQHSTQMKKLQEENIALHKKNSKLLEANAALQAKHRQLETDVDFLKDQMKALWQKSADAPPPVSDDDDKQLCQNSREPTQEEHFLKPATAEQELLLVDLSTQNRFSLLQEETPELNNKNPLPPPPPERRTRNVSDDKSHSYSRSCKSQQHSWWNNTTTAKQQHGLWFHYPQLTSW